MSKIDIVGMFPNYASAHAAVRKSRRRRPWTTPTCAISSSISIACWIRRTTKDRRGRQGSGLRVSPSNRFSDEIAALALYRAATRLLTPWRASGAGRARPARLEIRRGSASDWAWPGSRVRTASSCGCMARASAKGSGAPLAGAPDQRGFTALVTTGTKFGGGRRRACRQATPYTIHVPLDAPRFVNRFSITGGPTRDLRRIELSWPNLLTPRMRAARGRARQRRMSPRSYLRWRNVPKAAHALLEKIDIAFAQTNDDAAPCCSSARRACRLPAT